MANTIRPKRSYTAASVPAASIAGELSINAADGKIWITNASATSQILVSSLNRSDHTGTLAVASGGTGVTTSTGSGNVVLSTSPTLVTPILGTPTSGTLTNCTFPTLNQNTTGTAAGLSATLAISSGGTGATSANAAANAILPSQTSNSGKYLTTNGTDTSWGTVSSGTTLPTGALMPYAGASAPTGYLLCDGSSVSSSTYLALHAVISNTYGGSAYTGAAGLNFNLPDLKGRMPIGSMGTGSGLTARVTGTKYGTETHTVSSSNIQQFSTGAMSANENHTHGSGATGFWVYNSGLGATIAGGSTYNASAGGSANTASTNLAHTHNVGTASPTGINHLPPTIGLNYIIKT